MKKTTWLLAILYLVIFIGLGAIFYFKFLEKTTALELEPTLIADQESAQIYYSQDNNLWALNPKESLALEKEKWLKRLQSTGQVARLDLNDQLNLLVYDALVDNAWQIWQVDLATSQSEKLILTPAPKDFSNFWYPLFSPDQKFLTFLAAGKDQAVFLKDLTLNSTRKLTENPFQKIFAYSWDQASQNLLVCGQKEDKAGCWQVKLDNREIKEVQSGEFTEVSWDKTSEIFFLKKEQDNLNLFRSDGQGSLKKLTDIIAPKKVSYFSLDGQGQKIVYEVKDGSAADIYLIKADGTNLIQLTSDGKSSQPIFAPDSQKIAFLRQNEGIYNLDIATFKEEKILNLTKPIHQLLLWE